MSARADRLKRLPGQIQSLLAHPANRADRAGAVKRWLAWQIGARLVPGPVATPFVDDARLLISPGLSGATGNIHFGLAEYEDMAFALHLLRPGDVFVDVGANIGAYSVLAAAAGADVVAFEPVTGTADLFEQNIRLNDYASHVTLHRMALGAASGDVSITDGLDAMNHVARDGDGARVPVETLDTMLGPRSPTLIKIDVEGYEPEVLRGAAHVLAQETLLAVIVEINGACEAYGFTRNDVEGPLRRAGFTSCIYDPQARQLEPGAGAGGNAIFARDIESARARLASARRYKIASGEI